MEIVFIETTIVSYLVARPSRDLVLAAHQQITREWWEEERERYHCLTSEEVVRECRRGEAAMARKRNEVLQGLPVVPITSGIRSLADRFMKTGALPEQARPDAVHLAAAMEANATILLTWNCRHLANQRILKRLEREARRLALSLPVVCTPVEMQGGPT